MENYLKHQKSLITKGPEKPGISAQVYDSSAVASTSQLTLKRSFNVFYVESKSLPFAQFDVKYVETKNSERALKIIVTETVEKISSQSNPFIHIKYSLLSLECNKPELSK